MMEEKVREAIVTELERQAEANPSKLRISVRDEELVADGRSISTGSPRRSSAP
ncbi:hypothetical protein [Mesorhizobium mediterraneum]|uniref:hypothetical protein n=1 Tax=Mesorhizobium mediterraneum TaxID=43617 RepID=UPI00177AFD13|nr:hypothetical protein [Mesorhizobium mediterraneum]